MVREKLKEITIDSMRTDDIDEVFRIEAASFTKPWSAKLFYNEIRNPRCISRVARTGGKVAGYICAGCIFDEGHIHNLAVHQRLRRLGIARMLVRDMIDELKHRGCKSIFLEVRSSNEIAKKMYEKFNFSVLGIRKNYYDSPVEDGVVMVLRLNE